MSWNDAPHPRPNRSQEQLLSLVYEKAHSRGRTKRLQTGLTVAVAVVLIGGLTGILSRDNSGDSSQVRAVGGAPGSSASFVEATVTTVLGAAPPTVVPELPLAPGATAPEVVPPSLPPEPPIDPAEEPSPATPDPVATSTCRDSYEPTCGPLSWDPPPAANQPLTVSVTATPAAPKPGEAVTFRVVVSDPDSMIIGECPTIQTYGDGSLSQGCSLAACRGKFGPWTPVARPGHTELTYEHVYSSAGTYTARFGFTSEFCGGSEPYRSQGDGALAVVIA
jgi:hypothetical protein